MFYSSSQQNSTCGIQHLVCRSDKCMRISHPALSLPRLQGSPRMELLIIAVTSPSQCLNPVSGGLKVHSSPAAAVGAWTRLRGLSAVTTLDEEPDRDLPAWALGHLAESSLATRARLVVKEETKCGATPPCCMDPGHSEETAAGGGAAQEGPEENEPVEEVKKKHQHNEILTMEEKDGDTIAAIKTVGKVHELISVESKEHGKDKENKISGE
ncbi:uncharacterized protein LOC141512229 [Macrotis lagotis]|uniref:uncharacterized protein LOC141512229 n=1 Tax=Macrotis lagotis TaxID=92651 RepID=UPI003D681667